MKEELQEQITKKYKIWDVENKKWFKPIYPSQSGGDKAKKETREILFSQSGEMFLHHDSGIKLLTHVNQTQFIPCLYTGFKSKEGIKLYGGDVIKNIQAEYNIIYFWNGQWCYQNYHARALPLEYNPFKSENSEHEYIGNIFETPELIEKVNPEDNGYEEGISN